MFSLFFAVLFAVLAGPLFRRAPAEKGTEGSGTGESRTRLFGATYMTMNNPYFTALNSRLQEIVEANGDILISRDPAQDQEKQNQQIQDMLDEGIQLLFLNPADWKKVRPALEACKKAGVPIINIDTQVYDSGYIISSIMSDNYGAGVQCAEDIMKKKETASIVVLDSPPTNSIIQRVKGFTDTISGNGNYRIVDIQHSMGELEISMQVMTALLKKDQKIDVVFGGNDPTALGALAALQKSNMDQDVMIYGVDGSPDGKAAIKEGFMEGSSAQQPLKIASTAAEIAYCYLNKEPIEQNITIPVTLITKDNIQNFDISGWQ